MAFIFKCDFKYQDLGIMMVQNTPSIVNDGPETP